MRPRYCNRKGRPVRSKHVVVERMLPLLPKNPVNGHSIVTMKVISHLTPRPIAPKAPVEEETPESSTKEKTDSIAMEITETAQNNNVTLFIAQNDVPEVSIPVMANPTSPTSISNFLDLDIPNTDTNDLILSSTVTDAKEGITSFAGE